MQALQTAAAYGDVNCASLWTSLLAPALWTSGTGGVSGALVGEVLDAAAGLRARGLSERGFHALIAIAEKADTNTRQGSVRWDHIRSGLYGASQRTAERAVQDLKAAGLIRVVRPGFNNNHGRAAAPIYEIRPRSDSATQVTPSPLTDSAIQVAESAGGDTDKSEGRYRQNGDRYRHLSGVLDGSIDGPIDEESATDNQPRCNRHADAHRYPIPPACADCAQVRLQRDKLEEAAADIERARRAQIRQAIDSCPDCDGFGRLDDLSDCNRHANFRQRRHAS